MQLVNMQRVPSAGKQSTNVKRWKTSMPSAGNHVSNAKRGKTSRLAHKSSSEFIFGSAKAKDF